MHPIVISDTVVVPEEAMTMTATHASGPGGDNVTGVASKVHVHVEIDRIQGLRDEDREQLRHLAGRRVDAQGRLQIVSQKTPDQHRNLEDALEKIRALVKASLVHPPERLGTRATIPAVQKRLDEKHATAEKKADRGSLVYDDE